MKSWVKARVRGAHAGSLTIGYSIGHHGTQFTLQGPPEACHHNGA
jgi:hypothetical protein